MRLGMPLIVFAASFASSFAPVSSTVAAPVFSAAITPGSSARSTTDSTADNRALLAAQTVANRRAGTAPQSPADRTIHLRLVNTGSQQQHRH